MSLTVLFDSLKSKHPTNGEMLKQIIYTLSENYTVITMDSYGFLSSTDIKKLF